MTVTKENVASQFCIGLDKVQQLGSKQLFIAETPDLIVLVSYRTIVGVLKNEVWYLTDKKCSVTTSKQMSQFTRNRTVQYVDDLNNIPE